MGKMPMPRLPADYCTANLLTCDLLTWMKGDRLKKTPGNFLEPGQAFPDFDLQESNGKHHSFVNLTADAPVALFAVFKTDCPTSQFSLPYLNRLVEQVPGLPFVGISQDSPGQTEEFLHEWKPRFSLVLYEEEPYLLSNALGVTNVPSLYLVSRAGVVLACDFGYSEKFWESLARRAAKAFGIRAAPIVPPDAPRWAVG